MRKYIVVSILSLLLLGCHQKPIEKPFVTENIITNIVDETIIDFYHGTMFANYFPFLLISKIELSNNVEIIFADKVSNTISPVFNLTPLLFKDVPEHIMHHFGGLKWTEKLKLTKAIEGLDLSTQAGRKKSSELLDDLNKIQNKAIDEFKKNYNNPLDDVFVYFFEVDLAKLVAENHEFSKLIITDNGDEIYSKDMILNVHELDQNTATNSMFVRNARMNFEINHGNNLEFEYAFPLQVTKPLTLQKIVLDHPLLEIDTVYVRIKHQGILQEYDLSYKDIQSLDIEIAENSLLTLVPTIKNKQKFKSPFYYGNFNIEVHYLSHQQTDTLFVNSGIISSISDPFILKSVLMDNKDFTQYFDFINQVNYNHEKSFYAYIEADF